MHPASLVSEEARPAALPQGPWVSRAASPGTLQLPHFRDPQGSACSLPFHGLPFRKGSRSGKRTGFLASLLPLPAVRHLHVPQRSHFEFEPTTRELRLQEEKPPSARVHVASFSLSVLPFRLRFNPGRAGRQRVLGKVATDQEPGNSLLLVCPPPAPRRESAEPCPRRGPPRPPAGRAGSALIPSIGLCRLRRRRPWACDLGIVGLLGKCPLRADGGKASASLGGMSRWPLG